MKNNFLFLVLFSVFPFFGKTQEVENTVGKNHTIKSEVYNMDRQVQVYTPDRYDSSTKEYPVLYLLDGQRWFLQGVSYQRLFSEYRYTPDFIVVGIKTNDSPRFGFFASHEKLLSYLEKEVIPLVSQNYRVSDERLLFGWQFAGSFALNTLDKNPKMFDGYLAASPIPIDKTIIDIAEWNYTKSRTLFIATSKQEGQVNEGVNGLVSRLESYQKPLKWERKNMDMELISSFGHRTTPLGALYHGLRFYYNDYPLLEFDKLEDFTGFGGFENVYKYYQNRGTKYGISQAVPQEGMFFLVRLGLDANHYPTFDRFMKDFMDKGFLDGVNMGWGTRYAEFYLSNNNPEGAQKVYEILGQKFPGSARLENGLGKVFSAKRDFKEAERRFKSAIEIGEKNSDRRLLQYRKDLEELESSSGNN